MDHSTSLRSESATENGTKNSFDLPINILPNHSVFGVVFSYSFIFRSLDSTVEQQRLKKLKERKVEYIHSFETLAVATQPPTQFLEDLDR